MPTIKDLRLQRKLSQQRLAEMALVSIQAISRLENGKPVSSITFRRICKALDVDESNVSGVRFLKSGNSHSRGVQ